ncbi:MAG TPA: alpha-glucan family phosphorylase [Gammaproteobacteria bacterium]|nr:alpha-glucan family phosphorylase [Gammaproteobacteria bacterium]
MSGTRFSLEVQPRIPAKLARLEELASDLLYSWDRQVRGLFFRLDRDLWEACGHNPTVFMRRISQDRLEEATHDRIFMEDYNRVLTVYDGYNAEPMRADLGPLLDPQEDLIAYFCAEFGLHESVPIYSGGLGILAGDHCKAASDLGLPFVAVGLLYRQGYFTQTIDGQGNQVAHYTPTDFADLPVTPAVNGAGEEIHVEVQLPGRTVMLKVWHAKAGHIDLYLLDSDLPDNRGEDRRITYQLYGGDVNTRIQQEIVLGIGGVRALDALGLTPSVWHINEGHAAFQILERCRSLVAQNMDFDSALELVAAATVFTTHTPVPAGHDIFDPQLFATYFEGYARELGIAMEKLRELGISPSNHGGFNMTALAMRGSRHHNGVSRIHGSVASRMEGYVWPQIPHDENPIGYVTNGVHVPTFLAREWVNLFDMRFDREWRSELLNEEYWERIDDIPDQSYWSVRQTLKAELLEEVCARATRQCRRNGVSEVVIERLTRHLSPKETDVLTLGFARRFATYKRATLMFADPERLARLLNDPERPVVVLFAGKAHPHDVPGQELIRTIQAYSRRPEFEGKIIMLEDYDLSLGRKLVTGVDVWVNNPQYPLEASGTSGQKAGINGVINLSVLDGWWGEGYNEENGWGITPHGPQYDADFRDREESQALLDLLEEQVIPLYYQRNGHGYSDGWVRKSKASMKSIMPHFNAQRMVVDYVKFYYVPAKDHCRRLAADDRSPTHELAAWKTRVKERWPGTHMKRLDPGSPKLMHGDTLPIRVAAELNGLAAEDVVVECLVGVENDSGEFEVKDRFVLKAESPGSDAVESAPGSEVVFSLDFCPRLSGLQYYKIRMYPYHRLLSHPFETGCMIWL